MGALTGFMLSALVVSIHISSVIEKNGSAYGGVATTWGYGLIVGIPFYAISAFLGYGLVALIQNVLERFQ